MRSLEKEIRRVKVTFNVHMPTRRAQAPIRFVAYLFTVSALGVPNGLHGSTLLTFAQAQNTVRIQVL